MSSSTGKAPIKVRSLPIDQWPPADRTAWVTACKPSVRLQRGGRASHLNPVSQKDHASRYGLFLDFLQRHGRLDPNRSAGAHVARENVDAYLAELKARVSSITLYNSIHKLRRTCQLIAPQADLSWLIEIEKDLASEMIPRSKAARLVLTEVLVEAGLTLVAEAEIATHRSALARARQHRNGLMIAFLALHPIRLKNFSALEIGRTLVRSKNSWWIVLPGSETKEGRRDERHVDEMLAPALDFYLSHSRSVLARTRNPPPALWLSSHNGRPLSYSMIENMISAMTLSTIGVDVSPHLFRTSAASSAAILGGANPHLGSAVLHHTGRKVTNDSYNRASSMSACAAYREVIQSYRSP
jgi:hypothetical protein